MNRIFTSPKRATIAAAMILSATAALSGTAAWAQQGNGGSWGNNGGDERRQRDRGAYDVVRSNRLEGRLEMDRNQYTPNRGVEMRLTFTNNGDRMQIVTPGRDLMYLIEIRDDRSGRTIRTLRGRAGTLRLGPGIDYTYREIWDQRDDNGRSVPAGTYRVNANFYGIGRASTQIYLSGNGGGGRGDDNGGWGRGGNGRDNFPGDLGGRGDGGSNGGGGWGRGDTSNQFRTDLSVDRSRVRAGDRVTLTYLVVNNGRDSSTFRFSSGKQFDVEVSDPRGNSIWQASRGMFYNQSLTEITLRPGERRQFTTNWNVPRDARSGDYNISAYLTPIGSGQTAASRTRITVD